MKPKHKAGDQFIALTPKEKLLLQFGADPAPKTDEVLLLFTKQEDPSKLDDLVDHMKKLERELKNAVRANAYLKAELNAEPARYNPTPLLDRAVNELSGCLNTHPDLRTDVTNRLFEDWKAFRRPRTQTQWRRQLQHEIYERLKNSDALKTLDDDGLGTVHSILCDL